MSLSLRMTLTQVCSACEQGDGDRIPDHSMPRDLSSGQISADFCLALEICPACNRVLSHGWDRKRVRANLMDLGFAFAAHDVTMCPPASVSLPFDWIRAS